MNGPRGKNPSNRPRPAATRPPPTRPSPPKSAAGTPLAGPVAAGLSGSGVNIAIATAVFSLVGLVGVVYVGVKLASGLSGDGSAQVPSQMLEKRVESRPSPPPKESSETIPSRSQIPAETTPVPVDSSPDQGPDPLAPSNRADASPTEPAAAVPVAQVFDDVKQRNRLLPLPPLGSPRTRLARLNLKPAQNVDLRLLGMATAFGIGRETKLVADNGANGFRTWKVLRQIPNSFDSNETEEIGTFRLDGQDLSFAWNEAVSPSAEPTRLRCCLLEIAVDGERETCHLVAPIEIQSQSLNFNANQERIEFSGVEAASVPAAEHLRIKLTARGFPVHQISPAEFIRAQETATIHIRDPAQQESDLLKLEATFRWDPADAGGCRLEITTRIDAKLWNQSRVQNQTVSWGRKDLVEASQLCSSTMDEERAVHKKIAEYENRLVANNAKLKEKNPHKKNSPEYKAFLLAKAITERDLKADIKEDTSALKKLKADSVKRAESIELAKSNLAMYGRIVHALDQIADGQLQFELFFEVEDVQDNNLKKVVILKSRDN